MRKISLETHNVLENIQKIRDFMFTDLDKTIELVNSDKGAPNFMLALALCSYTEFWGKLMLPSKKDKKCFDTFFCKLGSKYEDLMNHPNTNIYGRIRCGLVHEYIIRANSRIVIEGGDCGIVYNEKSKTYTFCVRRYLEDLKFAVDRYIAEVRSDLASFNAAKRALENKPRLV